MHSYLLPVIFCCCTDCISAGKRSVHDKEHLKKSMCIKKMEPPKIYTVRQLKMSQKLLYYNDSHLEILMVKKRSKS